MIENFRPATKHEEAQLAKEERKLAHVGKYATAEDISYRSQYLKQKKREQRPADDAD